MPKRAPLDLDQFKIELPPEARDPLDSLIPTAPPSQQRKTKTGLADNHLKVVIPSAPDPSKKVNPAKSNLQTSRVTELQTTRLPDEQTSRVTELEYYEVPDFRKLDRIEARLSWEQNKYLNDLEAVISRDMPEGERADPSYRRITKNSIIRVLVEIARWLNVEVDASNFRSEKDLLNAVKEDLQKKLTELQTSRVTD